MKHATHLALALFMGTAFTSTHLAAAVTPYSADYTFSIEKSYKGDAKRTLKKEGKHWRFNFSASVPIVAKASQNTLFKYTTKGTHNYVPLSHDTTYKILIHKRKTNLAFDYANKQLNTSHKGKAKSYALKAPVLDELTLEMQIREDMRKGKLKSTYTIASHKGIRKVPFINEGKTSITVPAGKFDVIKIRRVHKDPKRKSYFWLAPSLDYLPVKVMQNDKGKIYDFELKKLYGNALKK